MTPENVTGPIAHHAEGPVWWPGWGGLRWVDGNAGDLLTLRADGVTRQHIDDEYLGFARPRAGGGLVAVGARTLYLADDVDGEARAVASLLDDPRVRMNDGCCDPRGRLLTGSMAYDATQDAGILLRLDAELNVTTMLPKTTISNGIGFSPDGRRAYYVDSLSHRIDVFDVAEGELRGRRAFAAIPADQGLPDGLTVAADGSVWVALWGGSAVHGYDATGALVETIPLPVIGVRRAPGRARHPRHPVRGLTSFCRETPDGLCPRHGALSKRNRAPDTGRRDCVCQLRWTRSVRWC